MIQQYKNTASKQHGFSLIEALVAFLILSVGMLGIASLQIISLKAGRTATMRTVAVIKSEEILERIRNNQTALDPATPASYVVLAGDPGVDSGCGNSASLTVCTVAQMAKDDIFNWKKELRNSLPNNSNTTASIEVLAKTPGTLPTATVTVTISWQERSQDTEGMEDMSYSVISHICDDGTC